MRKIIISFLMSLVCTTMMLNVYPTYASSNGVGGVARGVYMSSSTVYATIVDENDIVGRAVVTCLAQVKDIDVNMYLQRGYGTKWQNVSAAYNMHEQDIAELDRSAIIQNVTPGIYRVYIEVTVIGYDGLMDSVEVGTGTLTINT